MLSPRQPHVSGTLVELLAHWCRLRSAGAGIESHRARGESLAAFRAFELVKIDAADSIWRNRVSALRADSIEGCHYLFEIDFLLPGHLPILALDYVNCIVRL